MTTYTYDAANRLASIAVSSGSTVLWAKRYGYNAAGERIYTLHGDSGTAGDGYWLDPASQLRGVKYGSADATLGYASQTGENAVAEWQYDAAGNRVAETGSGGNTMYSSNNTNQYTAVSSVSGVAYSSPGDLAQFGDWTYSYDAHGNLIRANKTGMSSQYWRDAFGHRAVKDVNGSKTLFFNVGTTQLEAYDVTNANASSTVYEPGIDRPLAEVSSSGTLTFYHQDWLGSVVLLTGASGAKLQSFGYDVWGKPSGFDRGERCQPSNVNIFKTFPAWACKQRAMREIQNLQVVSKTPSASAFGLWGIVCPLFFFAALVLGARDDFEHPNSCIGNADWSGRLELWVEIAEIPVGHGVRLPLGLRFSSDARLEDVLFGRHWWCPLLESDGNATPEYLEFTTFGGDRRFLLKSDGWRSRDGKATGRENDGVLEIESGQWCYRYRDGRIVGASAPDGTRLNWLYQDGGLRAISRAGDGAAVLTVERSAGSVKVGGEFGDFVFRDEPGKYRLKFPDGREEGIGIAPDGEDVSKMTVVSRVSGLAGGTPAPRIFRWKTSTGALLSDEDFTYEIRRTDTGEDIMHRVDKKGRTEWYKFDTARGLATYKRQDGSRVQSWYHVESGPQYMKCFRMDTLSKDHALVSSRLIAYDAEGNTEKEWIEQGPAALERTSGVRYIGVAEAEQLHEKPGVLFLDARKKAEFEAGHIPGAIHLGRSSFEADYSALEPRIKAADTLVLYCTSRQCEDSSIVATRLSQLGYEKVLVFEGGWAEWWKRH